MTTQVLHIIPEGVFSNTYHGSYKDVISRVDQLRKIAGEYRQLQLAADDPAKVLGAVHPGTDLRLLVEYSTFPQTVRAIREQHPNSFIAVRSHNIEPLQLRDNHGWWPRWGPLWMIYGMGRLLKGDIACKRYADAIYSISDWEERVYWDRLPGRARVEWLPYHCPNHLLPTSVTPPSKRRVIACLPTLVRHRKSVDLVRRFIQFAEQARAVAPCEYEFVLTGLLEGWGIPNSSAVIYAGVVEDLRDLLRRSAAVCMLSPLGYGFKTTIVDAIAHGSQAIVHPRLLSRSPQLLQPGLTPLENSDSTTVKQVLKRLNSSVSHSRIQQELQQVAVEILAQDLVRSTSDSSTATVSTQFGRPRNNAVSDYVTEIAKSS
ncbi:MAG: hypothetical protein ACK5Q5_12345 [Planctomycetaceae bacterium]